MPKYSRAGVEGAVCLCQQTFYKGQWGRIEGKYDEMILEKGGDKLATLDKFCHSLGERLRGENNTLSKEDFLQVVDWKFTKGKARHGLLKYLNSNSEAEIQRAWRAATTQASTDNVRGAIDALTILKGVGPATASAFLSWYKPATFAFMDDEVIECLYEGKRGYTIKIYLDVNEKCISLGNTLGWTPGKVGRALWTAARIHACGIEDLTIPIDPPTFASKKQPRVKETSAPQSSKKQKRGK